MKALQISELGKSDVMKIIDLPLPEIKPHQILVKIEAGGLNYADIMMREGKYIDKVTLPYVMGREFGGVIEQLGSDVRGWQVGQRVIGSSKGGAFAEYIAVSANGLMPVPEDMEVGTAVAMLAQGVTAIHCLDDCARLQPGETVLVHGAAGGVGTLAIQVAKQRGAFVIGTASTDEKCELIRELGAQAINYGEGHDWVAELKALTDGKGADVILEIVGGETFLKSFREALAELGRLIVVGAASTEAAKVSNVEILASSKSIIGYFLPRYIQTRPGRMVEATLELIKLIQAGHLKPIIGQTFPLDQAAAAFDQMQNRQTVGKTLIVP